MRRVYVLPAFGLCATALLGVMAWLTAGVRRLEQAEGRAREQAALEESVRLALWRMESLLGPLLARENSRSPAAYRLPDDLAEATHVRLLAQWDARGRLHTRAPARAVLAPPPAAARRALLARLPEEWATSDTFVRGPLQASADLGRPPAASQSAPLTDAQGDPTQRKLKAPADVGEQQQALGQSEYQARALRATANAAVLLTPALTAPSAPRALALRLGRLEPLWLEGELLLARRVSWDGEPLLQACWLDGPALHATLLDAIRDLLPAARLQPAGPTADPARRLAALPLELVPGPPTLAPPPGLVGGALPLGAAWALAGLALAASGALFLGLANLGERRAAFVSAVSHELRTPLTTFRMYADMLAEGLVPPADRHEYLDTLRREAERQAHLVENVLAYARLERGRYRAARERLALGELLAGLRESLASQAERAGMQLVGPAAGDWNALTVRVDRAGVERILLNLVDNACKYARQAQDRRIHLECSVEPRRISVCVRDHGPGVVGPARRLFRPFHKSAREAAHSAPGVGLGLALSRRLARALGGELRLVSNASGGACFCLRLPRA